MIRSQVASIFFVLAVLAPIALGQLCWVTVTNGESYTQCRSAPIYTRVEVIEDRSCSYTNCLNKGTAEQYTAYLRSASSVPIPREYLQVQHFQDANCTIADTYNTTEYYGLNRNCTEIYGISVDTQVFSARCNETHAYLQRYNTTACDMAPVLDEVYPVQQCHWSAEGYVLVTCLANSGAVVVQQVPSMLLLALFLVITMFGL